MKNEELLKLSPGELTDMGICPTCFNRENGGALYGDNSDKLLYEDEDIECFFVGNPRADGHMCISTIEHYHDMSEAPDHLNEKIIRFAKRFMQIIREVYGCERVYMCTMCDGPNNHYHIQLIPRYAYEKRGSANFVKARKAYERDEAKLVTVRRLIAEYATGILTENFKLVRPTSEYASQIAEYRQEFLDVGDSMDGTGPLRRFEKPEEYIKTCAEYEDPEKVPSHLVPATQFLFVRKNDNKLVGMLQVRHYFNDYLEKYAGHIGYSVRPSERRKGYAKQMLKTALPFCREIGLDKVLITCVDGNVGSEKTILANGGVYESTSHEPNEHKDLKRFWIEL